MLLRPVRPCYIHDAVSLFHSGAPDGNGLCIADEPDYKSVLTDMNLRRRMGRLLKMAVWCGLRTLENVPPEDVAGIITVTGMGFMKDTVAFGNSLFDRQEELLNPSPFMQSTFNTASGYLALIRKIRAYNTTYVHGAGGLAAAMVDAVLHLEASAGKGVLVGAFDEAIPEVDAVRRRLHPEDGNPLGEGACSFYLSQEESDVRFHALAPADGGSAASCQDHVNADVRIVRCSDHVAEMGVFPSMLPVLACRMMQEHALQQGYTAFIDDIDKDGQMLLVEKR